MVQEVERLRGKFNISIPLGGVIPAKKDPLLLTLLHRLDLNVRAGAAELCGSFNDS
jgi:hypothetical protein